MPIQPIKSQAVSKPFRGLQLAINALGEEIEQLREDRVRVEKASGVLKEAMDAAIAALELENVTKALLILKGARPSKNAILEGPI